MAGEADGPRAGLAALDQLAAALPRYTASSAYLHERAGDIGLYADAAAQAHNVAERNHLTLRAAALNQRLSAGDQ